MIYPEKKGNLFLLSGLVMVFLIVPGVTALQPQTGHPYMLFHDISEVPGYQYRAMDPWKSWETSIVSNANYALTFNFAGNLGGFDRLSYRGSYARDLGLAYQITKKPEYAAKATEALVHMETGTITSKTDRSSALGGYSLAYDWIQPTLDPSNDTTIRDKLATLSDTVYKDLNDNGTSTNYIAFADYHGQAYPEVGVASAALYDYTNPNHLPLSSTPADWYKVGTEYLFSNDKLHIYGQSLFSFGFDEESGKNLYGAYKSYVISDYVNWFQVCNHTYNENLFEKYPAAKKAFTSEVWESLPNHYGDNYATSGNVGWAYQEGIVSLLPDNEKGQVLNHIERLRNGSILPYSSVNGGSTSAMLYSTFGNYTAIPRTYPPYTSHFDPHAITQLFRGNWSEDSDWLSLITFNKVTRENRNMLHNDQLSFEYYSRGDLLLADAGEQKYVLEKWYGYYDIDHNTIAIENPRSPFPVSPWSGSTSQGIYKGNANGLSTPVNVPSVIQTPWIQAIQTNATINYLNAQTFGSFETLSSPVRYERTILYPESDYLVIVDRLEGTQPWVFRSIFRPTSLVVTPTADANNDGVYAASEVGHVNGALTVGTTPYNWQALPYKTETNTGITASSLTWTTKNPYGKDVRLNLFSSPSSEILAEKNVGRIGGYDYRSEVFSPILWFRTPAANAEYRVTALLSSYSNEEVKTPREIDVTGTGHAMNVHSSTAEDYIYTGKGNSSFSEFTTDAGTAFIRKTDQTSEFTLIDGSSLQENNKNLVTISKIVNYFTFKQEGKTIKFKVKGQNNVDVSLPDTIPLSVTCDGVPFNTWTVQNNTTVLKISADQDEHEFEIQTDNILHLTSLIDQRISERSRLSFAVNAVYTGSGNPVFSATNLPRNATFDPVSHTFEWTPVAGETGHFEPVFRVTDGTLSDSKTVVITVSRAEDFTGVFRSPTGNWYLDTTRSGVVNKTFHFGTTGDSAVVGDWDADGKSDIGIFRPSNGNWYLDTTRSGVVNKTFHFGTTGDSAVAGDWDGNGRTDPGVFRPSNGNWYLDTTRTGVINTMFHFGKAGDIPVVGDWDGNGRTETGVFRPSSGNWYLDTTMTGAVNKTFHFGTAGDIPVVGDWDGNGRTETGVFRPSSGNWYLDTTMTGAVNKTFHFGTAGDIPVVGDWDGNGRSETGVFRPSSGNWYFDTTMTGAVNKTFHFGKTEDVPKIGTWN